MIIFLAVLLFFQESLPMAGFRYTNPASSSLKDLCIPIVIKQLETSRTDVSKIPVDVQDLLTASLKRKHAHLFYRIFKETFQPQVTLQPEMSDKAIVLLDNCRLCLKIGALSKQSILWDVENNIPLLTFEESGTFAVTQDHRYLYHCSSDKTATIYSLKTMSKVASYAFDPFTDVLVFDPRQEICISYPCKSYDGHCGHCFHCDNDLCECTATERMGWAVKPDSQGHKFKWGKGLVESLNHFYSLIIRASSESYILIGRKKIAYFKNLLMHQGFTKEIFYQRHDELVIAERDQYFTDSRYCIDLKTGKRDYQILVNHTQKYIAFGSVHEERYNDRAYRSDTGELIEAKWKGLFGEKVSMPSMTSRHTFISGNGNKFVSIDLSGLVVFDISKAPESQQIHSRQVALPWREEETYNFDGDIRYVMLNFDGSLAVLVAKERNSYVLRYYLYNLKTGHCIEMYNICCSNYGSAVRTASNMKFTSEGNFCIASYQSLEGSQRIVKFDFSKIAPTLRLQEVLFLVALFEKENVAEYIKSSEGKSVLNDFVDKITDEVTKNALKRYLLTIGFSEK